LPRKIKIFREKSVDTIYDSNYRLSCTVSFLVTPLSASNNSVNKEENADILKIWNGETS
jgi:hypothetical protein